MNASKPFEEKFEERFEEDYGLLGFLVKERQLTKILLSFTVISCFAAVAVCVVYSNRVFKVQTFTVEGTLAEMSLGAMVCVLTFIVTTIVTLCLSGSAMESMRDEAKARLAAARKSLVELNQSLFEAKSLELLELNKKALASAVEVWQQEAEKQLKEAVAGFLAGQDIVVLEERREALCMQLKESMEQASQEVAHRELGQLSLLKERLKQASKEVVDRELERLSLQAQRTGANSLVSAGQGFPLDAKMKTFYYPYKANDAPIPITAIQQWVEESQGRIQFLSVVFDPASRAAALIYRDISG